VYIPRLADPRIESKTKKLAAVYAKRVKPEDKEENNDVVNVI